MTYDDGICTSIKSIDLRATSYQNPEQLERTLNRYLDKLERFQGMRQPNGVTIRPIDIQKKVLHLGIPNSAITDEQVKVLERIAQRAQQLSQHTGEILRIKVTALE